MYIDEEYRYLFIIVFAFWVVGSILATAQSGFVGFVTAQVATIILVLFGLLAIRLLID